MPTQTLPLSGHPLPGLRKHTWGRVLSNTGHTAGQNTPGDIHLPRDFPWASVPWANSVLCHWPDEIPKNTSVGQPFLGKMQASDCSLDSPSSRPGGRLYPLPSPQERWQPTGIGRRQPGPEPGYRVFHKKHPRILPSGGWPNGAKGKGEGGDINKLPAWASGTWLGPHSPACALRTWPVGTQEPGHGLGFGSELGCSHRPWGPAQASSRVCLPSAWITLL